MAVLSRFERELDEGKKAVIVGGASGFGRATAEALTKRGASVALLDRPQSKG